MCLQACFLSSKAAHSLCNKAMLAPQQLQHSRCLLTPCKAPKRQLCRALSSKQPEQRLHVSNSKPARPVGGNGVNSSNGSKEGSRQASGRLRYSTQRDKQQPSNAVADSLATVKPQRRSNADGQKQQQQERHQQQEAKQAAADPVLANMRRPFTQLQSWQQRQQQQQQKRPRQQRQQRAAESAAAGQQKVQAVQSRFSGCNTYLAVLSQLQQLQESMQPCMVQQQQAQQQQESAGKQDLQHSHQVSSTTQQQEPQELLWHTVLSAADTISLLEQLAAISRSSSNSSSSTVSSSSTFIEDQALQQLLPLAYDLLDHYAHSSPQPPAAPATAAAAAAAAASGLLRPRDVLRCVGCLASLKYSMPARLSGLLEAHDGFRPGLAGLRIGQLSGLAASLARAGVRPTNAWLVAFMQEAQAKMTSASLAQLSQLLSGLVKLGVKPAASWLDSMQDQAVHCLVAQAVRWQVNESQRQQWQQQADPETAAESACGPHPHHQQQTAAAQGKHRRTAGCRLRDVAQLLSALAEAKHIPKPQLAAALWGATASSLAAADVAALVELLGALGELQLVPPGSWMQQYYAATALHFGQYKPWQLASSVAALGRLVIAGLKGCSKQSQQQQQPDSSSWGCHEWIQAALAAVQQQLASFAVRDLTALLTGLAALQLQLGQLQLQPILEEAKQKLPRLNTAGLAALLEAAVALEQQQQQQQLGYGGPDLAAAAAVDAGAAGTSTAVLLTNDWIEAFIRETAVKLPMFPADDLARVLLSLEASGTQPSPLWLEAAAAQLRSKLTLLEPAGLVRVLHALLSMKHMPDEKWVGSAVASLEGRMEDLQPEELQQLLQELVAVQAKPSAAFFESAHWAVQQLGQHQQLDLQQEQCTAVAAVHSDVCQQLLQQLEQGAGAAAVVSSMA